MRSLNSEVFLYPKELMQFQPRAEEVAILVIFGGFIVGRDVRCPGNSLTSNYSPSSLSSLTTTPVWHPGVSHDLHSSPPLPLRIPNIVITHG